MTKRYILILAAIMCGVINVAAQGFHNLTAEQVKIDSILPKYCYSLPLGANYADSVYSVAIEYPEFINMSDADVKRYKAISTSKLPEIPVVEQGISVSRKQGMLDLSLVPLVFRDGKYKKLVSFKLTVSAVAKAKPKRSGAQSKTTSRYASESVLRSGKWAKIRIPANGIYQITADLIRKAGFNNLDKVKLYGYGGALQPELLTDDYLIKTDDLKEVPTCNIEGKRLFYGQGPVTWTGPSQRIRNPYSNYGYYFLTENDSAALMVDSVEFVKSFYPSYDFMNTLCEPEEYAWFHGGRNLFDSKVFGNGNSCSYTIESAGNSALGYLTVTVTTNAATIYSISLNDSTVGSFVMDGPSSYNAAATSTKSIRVKNLKPTNTVVLSSARNADMRLDNIIINTNDYKPLPDFKNTAFAVPEYVYRITNQNLHAHEAVDMVIIIPATQKLRAQAERLKALHERLDSMTVRIIPADELFNEFSSGTPDASAYRRYMKMLYDRAQTEDEMPKYLVLFGDGAWDNRMCISNWRGCSPDDFLLCFESENSFSETDCYVSDDFFCLLDDGEQIEQKVGTNSLYKGKPDLAVGRFPVRNDAEAKIMVDKIEAYTSKTHSGAWQNTIVMMGDDGNENMHMDQANDIGKMIESTHPGYDVKRIMWDAYKRVASSTGHSYPDATQLIKQYMTNGALIMNYSGHGSPNSISHETVLKLADFKDNVSNKLALWLTASCDIMPFDGQEENIGESAILNPRGGAIAFYGTTRTVYSHMNKLINTAFMRRMLDVSNGPQTIGEAVRLAKNDLVNSSQDNTANKLQYTLVGDPALKLSLPTMRATIDSINGVAVTGDKPLQLKAGMQVKVTGHIDDDGVVAEDFNGSMTASVYDVLEEIVCKYNNQGDDGTSRPFVYNDRTKTLFKGTDGVRNGKFAFSFAVPKDISYSDGNGMITVHAITSDKGKMAHGINENFLLNGSVEMNKDSIGPSIYCYLNSTAFTNGDKVNATPYFVAEISDEDGINSTGNGIGHDLELIIDGEMAKTYNLNENFTFDYGSYKSGKLGFSIPALEPGEHKLLFRAWDVLNNSSTSELAFTVAGGVQPRLFDVECLINPATTSTSFRIIHDRIGSQMDVVLDIFDMSGRHLWSRSENGVPTDNALIIDWDLKVSSGSQLHTGVYLYRVRIACGGSNYASKAKKMIVISNK